MAFNLLANVDRMTVMLEFDLPDKEAMDRLINAVQITVTAKTVEGRCMDVTMEPDELPRALNLGESEPTLRSLYPKL